MDRRKFLTGSGSALAAIAMLSRAGEIFAKPLPLHLSQRKKDLAPLNTESDDLTPYTGPWNDSTLRHLLRRSMFGVPLSQFITAQAMGSMDAVVTKLLTEPALPPEPASYVGVIAPPDPADLSDPNYGESIAIQDAVRLEQMREYQIGNWWMTLIFNEYLSIRERMTLMWSNHFVIGIDVVLPTAYAYTYNQMLRSNALGNMKDFVKSMSKDPAMLIYLNGNQNFDGNAPGTSTNAGTNINENFARELQELFTLGLFDPVSGKPNYSETDVRQAAKALTGWAPTTVSPFLGQFYNTSHNNDQKTFLGQTGNWGMDDIINIIFSYTGPDGANRPGFNTAYWYCQKIYSEFVYYVPNVSVVTAMANLMLDSNFDIKPVLKALLESAHFYDPAIINAQVKSPVHYLASFIREFGLTYPPFDATDPPEAGRDPNGVKNYFQPNPIVADLVIYILGQQLGQQLLQPPNVKGWPGGRSWLNTGTYLSRSSFPQLLLGSKNLVTFQSPSDWVRALPGFNTMKSHDMAQALTQMVLNRTLGPNETASMYSSFNPQNLQESDFTLYDQNVISFAMALTSLPEFQLA